MQCSLFEVAIPIPKTSSKDLIELNSLVTESPKVWLFYPTDHSGPDEVFMVYVLLVFK